MTQQVEFVNNFVLQSFTCKPEQAIWELVKTMFKVYKKEKSSNSHTCELTTEL